MKPRHAAALVLAVCSLALSACASSQQASGAAGNSQETPLTPEELFIAHHPGGASPSQQPTAQFIPASQNNPAHYRFTLPNGWMDAYPDWPNLHYLIIRYSNGERIWGMPLYQSPNCPDSNTCRQALFNVNKGPILEVLTLDGKPVLESSLWQITDPKTQRIVYVARSGSKMVAAPDLQSLAQQVSQPQQSAIQASQSPSPPPASGEEHPYLKAGVQIVEGTLAAVLVLGTAYLNYRAQVQASYNANNFSCTSSEMGNFWYTNCHR